MGSIKLIPNIFAKRKSVLIVFLTVLILMVSSVSVYAATVGDQLPSPETGWQRIQSNDNRIVYENFYLAEDELWNGGSSMHVNITADSWNCSFKFYGTKVRLLGALDYNRPKKVNIKIDGVTQPQFSTYGSTDQYSMLLFEKTELIKGNHTVEVFRDTTDPAVYFDLDAIDLDDTGYLIDPSQPLNFTATPDSATVHLSWDSVEGATGYNVYRSTTPVGPYDTIVVENYGDTSYTDPDVANGTTYYYIVKAIINGAVGTPSNEASATPYAAVDTGNALLVITMVNGAEKEYQMTVTEVNNFIDWYDGKANGTGNNYYVINKDFNLGPFQSRTDYLVFDKIMNFEVNQYQ